MTVHPYMNRTRTTGEYKVVTYTPPSAQTSEFTERFLEEALKDGYELVSFSGNVFIFWYSFGCEVDESYVQARKLKPPKNSYFNP